MFPELIKLGPNFTINTYGVFIAIAFLGGVLLTAKLAEEDGLDRGTMYDLCLYMLIASLVGSRVLLVITEWEQYRLNLKSLFSIDFLRSGGVFYGGLIGASLASIFLMRHYKLPWWKTADACAPGIALGQFFGRLGCFAAGCCWGKCTTSWVGVHFSTRAHELTGVPIDCALHPTQLYESISTLILCFGLLFLRKRRSFDGQIILAYFFCYAAIRFSIEFFRDDPRGAVSLFGTQSQGMPLELSTSQLIALLFVVLSGLSLWFLRRRSNQEQRSEGAK